MQAENRIGLNRSIRLDRCVNRVRKSVCNKRLDWCVNREAGGQIFRGGIYLGVSVEANLLAFKYFCQSVWTCIKVLYEHILCIERY